ncbi:MAG: 30S ribosomal protein S11 [Prochloraceae cyanobacterium]
MAKTSKKGGAKKQKRNVPNGIAYIQSTFNNTIVTISDGKGDVISWASAGSSGFKGAKKGTPFAAQTAADSAARQAIDQGMRQIEVMVSGPGAGRETAIRALQGSGLEITLIRDVTPIPHNGCRPPKRRRV